MVGRVLLRPHESKTRFVRLAVVPKLVASDDSGGLIYVASASLSYATAVREE